MLHIADISGQAKSNLLSKKWANRCFEEFFLQGDDELRLGLPLSPNCDRKTTQITDSQIGFIQFVVRPAFEVLVKAIPELHQVTLPQIDQNHNYWLARKEIGDDSIEIEISQEQASPPSPIRRAVPNESADPLGEVFV